MTVFLSIFGGAGWQFSDANGTPLVGGKIYSYEAGTTTPAPTYTSSSGATAHPNPIILDSAGRVPGGEIWQPSATSYKYALYTALDVLIGTFDNIGTIASGSAAIARFSGNGSTVNFTLPSAPANENATNVFISGVYQQKDTYSLSGATLTFSQAPPKTTIVEVNYF